MQVQGNSGPSPASVEHSEHLSAYATEGAAFDNHWAHTVFETSLFEAFDIKSGGRSRKSHTVNG